MAVAFDAYSTSSGVDTSHTHTPVGTPRGVLVFVVRTTDQPLVSLTYGGTSMGSPVASISNAVGGELANVTIAAYVLGSSVPTGAQTVAADGGAGGVVLYVYTVTAAADVEFVNHATIESTSQANPSTTLSLSSRTSFVAEAFYSGQDATGGVTPSANWTARTELDAGTAVTGSYSYDTVGSANVSVGLTQTAEDILLIAAGVSEVVAGAVKRANFMLMGVGW